MSNTNVMYGIILVYVCSVVFLNAMNRCVNRCLFIKKTFYSFVGQLFSVLILYRKWPLILKAPLCLKSLKRGSFKEDRQTRTDSSTCINKHTWPWRKRTCSEEWSHGEWIVLSSPLWGFMIGEVITSRPAVYFLHCTKLCTVWTLAWTPEIHTDIPSAT